MFQFNRVPLATYRLQFGATLRLADALKLVPYLHALGVTDIYASPLLTARPGSAHGYDVIDPTRLDPEIGTEEDLLRLHDELREHDMGLLLDFVSNHMAAAAENPWWNDVLEHGLDSPYASFFDIEWTPTTGATNIENKVLLPVLGQRYWQALESRDVRLEFGANGFAIRYYDSVFPVSLASYPMVFDLCVDERGSRLPPNLQRIVDGVREADPAELLDAARKKDVNRRMARLRGSDSAAAEAIERCVAAFNGEAGRDRLDALLDRQAYRLIYWRRATSDINYRRFFDVGDLVGIRVDREEVFDAVHGKVLEWVREGKVTGLRIDHVDGLRDPAGYLARLQQEIASSRGAATGRERPDRAAQRDFYVLVEKILAPGEDLPPDFEAAGTSGYDFLNEVTGLLLDPGGVRELIAAYQRWTGRKESFEEICYRRKKQVIATLFAGDLRMLGLQLLGFAGEDRAARNVSSREVVQALIEVTAALPVYRTYTRSMSVASADRAVIERAVAEAKRRNPLEAPIYEFLCRVLLLEEDIPPETKEIRLEFVRRWQQFTGPVMAKGVEDTVFYGYSPLLALNEVGGEAKAPQEPPVERFHRFNTARQEQWPFTLNASSTHDTKRSEDVRARLAVLSEIPALWKSAFTRWAKWNAPLKSELGGVKDPTAEEELHLYQTLLGVWPLGAREVRSVGRRVGEYLVKALREGKTNSSWIEPNEAYEKRAVAFAKAILRSNRFKRNFLTMQSRLAWYGAINALSQTVLKIGSPGIPDLYQGTERWTLSLVDPDNRRPVEFGRAARELNALGGEISLAERARLVRRLLRKWKEGTLKLYATGRALAFRRAHAEVFLRGRYVPLSAHGAKKEHVVAFARELEHRWAIVVVPRLPTRLARQGQWPLGAKVWGTTAIELPPGAPGEWRNVFTEERITAGHGRIRLADVLGAFPVAMLESDER